MKHYKVLDLNTNIHHFVCIKFTEDENNPYRVYLQYWGWDHEKGYHRQHRRQIAKLPDIRNVMDYLTSLV